MPHLHVAQEIEFAQWRTQLAQHGIGRGGMKVQVGLREGRQKIVGCEGDLHLAEAKVHISTRQG